MQADAFQGLLLDGETIVWWDQPAQGLLFTRNDRVLVPFSLFFLGFWVFWEAMTTTAPNVPTFLSLWGVPFLLAGLYLFIGRCVVDAWARRGITYAVTDKRVLIQRSAPFAKFTAMSFDQLPSVNLIEQANGRGTIRFGKEPPTWTISVGGWSPGAAWSPAFDPTPQFIAIEDARGVFEHIQMQLAKRV
jgi:hypothetical protein